MLLAIDIGNMYTTMALMEEKSVKRVFRVSTQPNRTCDEFGLALMQLLALSRLHVQDVETVIVSCVVPSVMNSSMQAIKQYLHLEPIIIAPGIKTGINIRLEDTKNLGANCLADCCGAFHTYGTSLLVIDFGTTTTYNIINEDGAITSGLITTGLQASARALWDSTAQLPQFEIVKPSSIITKNTIQAMQAGVFYQYIGGVKYIIEHLQYEYLQTNQEKLHVIATGLFSSFIAPEIDEIDIIDNNLMFKGMQWMASHLREARVP